MNHSCSPPSSPDSPFRIQIKSRGAKTAKVGAQSRHAFSIERFQSVRSVGFFPHPRFPYRALAKNLGYKVYPGCAHSKHRIRAHGRRHRDSREFRAVARSRERNRAFVSASSTGWNKKMGGALDVTGPDLGPGDQAARLGLRSVGPFPLPILSLSLSLPFFLLSRVLRQRRDECKRE